MTVVMLEKCYQITHRVQCCIYASIRSTQRCFLQIHFDMIRSRRCRCTALGFRCVEKHFEGSNGMKLSCFLIHFAWNDIFPLSFIKHLILKKIKKLQFLCFVVCEHSSSRFVLESFHQQKKRKSFAVNDKTIQLSIEKETTRRFMNFKNKKEFYSNENIFV